MLGHQMNDLINTNVLAVLTLLLALSVFLLFLYSKRIRTQMRTSIKLIDELYRLSQAQQAQLSRIESTHTNNTVNETSSKTSEQTPNTDTDANMLHALAQRLDSLEQQYQVLENQTQMLQSEDPALKMYNKASLLVKSGASIEDIIEASELPRAEVEILMGVHQNRKSPKNK